MGIAAQICTIRVQVNRNGIKIAGFPGKTCYFQIVGTN